MSAEFDTDTSKDSSQYKLYYFNGNGRAIIIRAILYYSKSLFSDVKITKEDWTKLKQTGKFESEELPVMEYKGKLYSQMHAIEQYLGYAFRCKDEKEKEEAKKSCIEKCHFYIKKIEERYIKLGKGKYYLGDYFSLADIFITVVLTNFADKLDCDNIVKEQGPNISALIERIKKNELKTFFDKGYIKDSKF